MFRLWGKIIKDTRLTKDTVIYDQDYTKSRTEMIFNSLTAICNYFDLAEPLWLDSNIRSFKKHHKTRFYKDNFIEEINFDFLEIEILEE